MTSEEAVAASASLTLLDLDREAAVVRGALELGVGTTTHDLALDLPAASRHGYGLRLVLHAGTAIAEATSAVEALEGWWQSPRHAAVTDYADADASSRAAHALRDWHVNVVQHYDWMWRHYRYSPPDGAREFADALGRFVSHDAVHASVETGREYGIASLAYGSVYGAEPEYVEDHPDERVFDDAGESLSLGGTFFINDIRPGSPWRTRILAEYSDAIGRFGFDGIHMDTYGPPHRAVSADGEAIDFAELYPGLIEEAAAVVAHADPAARVLFNCVDGFPLESVAPAPAAALYLELWPPDRALGDVVGWIDRARALAGDRQVIIAAYAAALRDGDAVDDRASAFEPTVLLGSVIAAAGAYHHTLAEGDRLLVEGYYPAAVAMTPAEAVELQALWRFSARYVHLLSDPGLAPAEVPDLRLQDADGRDVRWSAIPEPGMVWARAARVAAGQLMLHLVDLREQADLYWDAPKRPALEAEDLRVVWPGAASPVAASPWSSDGDVRPLSRDGGAWRLPPFRRWLMVVASPART